MPFPIIAAVVIALVAHFGLMRTSYGAILRGAGGNPVAIDRAGWSLLKTKVDACSRSPASSACSPGMALIGLTTSADANIGNGYTLLSIAGVILGGGEFVGGRVSPIGAVIGALTLALAASPLLTFMHIPPDWQVGANGAILIIVLAARALDQPQGELSDDRAPHSRSRKPWIWSFVGALAGLARHHRLHRRPRRAAA